MNTERLLALAAHLRTPLSRPFDAVMWDSCAIGHAPDVPEFKALGVYRDEFGWTRFPSEMDVPEVPYYVEQYKDPVEGASFFGLSASQFHCLNRDGGARCSRSIAARIERFVAQGGML